MRNSLFAVIIITHGRPDSIYSDRALRRHGYTGPIYYLLDNLDSTYQQYKDKYGDNVLVFDKKDIASKTDQGDNFNDLRTTTHARNASFEIAKKLGLKYFIQFDDDYTGFQYRFDKELNYKTRRVGNFDHIFDAMIDFLEETKVETLCFAQGGDFIGGSQNPMAEKIQLKRKAMNSFLFCTDRPLKFISRLNEDVNTYISEGQRGKLLFTTNQISLVQKQTQGTPGGMTEAYLKYGTYVKSFSSVMYCPSSVKVSELTGGTNKRIHHSINWNNTVPKILSEQYKKK